ncbi:MAG TPA: Rrf2 family transcriptional regulator [Candidatus Methylacidiphilales bacterium]
MLSRKTKYGLRALIYLAQEQGKGPIQIRDISDELHIPRKFLEAILLELRNSGILQSRQGKQGGYFLERAPDTISVGHVVRMFDGPLADVPCVSQTAYSPCEDCTEERLCSIRWVMKEVRDASAKILDNATLDQLVTKAHDLNHGPQLDYYI